MCQMRGLKEYKEKHPDYVFDFVSCEYLHTLAATHTDLFNRIVTDTFEGISKFIVKHEGYDKVIEFQIDWPTALKEGILKAWTKKTLGFTPSTDKPYWIPTGNEFLVAINHANKMRNLFKKLVFMQLEAPSGYVRSFQYEDWERVLDLIPNDVGIVYPGPIDLALNGKLRPRPNLFMLPGYDIGVSGPLISECDFVFVVHGGMAMMSRAMEKKEVIHIVFQEGGRLGLLNVTEWTNHVFPSHRDVKWNDLQESVNKFL